MTPTHPHLGDVRYKAATQAFEALATFHMNCGQTRIATTFTTAIDTPFEQVARGLWQSALTRLNAENTLRSMRASNAALPRKQPRHASRNVAWTRILSALSQKHAA